MGGANANGSKKQKGLSRFRISPFCCLDLIVAAWLPLLSLIFGWYQSGFQSGDIIGDLP